MKTLTKFVLFALAIECGLATAHTSAIRRNAQDPIRQPASKPEVPWLRTNIPYLDAKPILQTLREDLLPANLRAQTPAQREAAWPAWVSRRDADIRGRVAIGDEDSIVNLVLFGTTFTTRPRATERQIAELGGPTSASAAGLVRARIEDLIAGIASPGPNERLRFARAIVERKGMNPATAEGKGQLHQYIIDLMTRVARENGAYDRTLQSEELTGDPSLRLAELSTLFRNRGLASDTSIFPSFAVEGALEAIKSKKLIGAGAVRRVAIVGPGLDVIDKAHGYDFYPEQTIQPFAVVDSLTRLGLAARDTVRVTTFDVNPRVNQHLESARRRARVGGLYVLYLPRDQDEHWTSELAEYWERFGDRIGAAGRAIAAPAAAGNVRVRAVRVRQAIVTSITPQDVNVVLQRLEPPTAGEGFDLVVATNILVYYDVFEQSLALTNVAKMTRPGGLFLTNDPILELPSTPLTQVGYTDIVYTDGFSRSRLSWYQRQ